MTPQQIVGLGIRLLAIWLGLSCIKYWGHLAPMLASNGDSTFSAYAVGLAFVLIALLLWFFPMSVAHRIIPRTRFENHLTVQALDAARVGCSVIGLGVFATVVPNFIWFIFRVALNARTESFFRVLTAEDKIEMAIWIGEIAFSLILIFRSADFACFVLRTKQEKSNAE